MAKRKNRKVQVVEVEPENELTEFMFDETSDMSEVVDRMREVGIGGIDDISIGFFRKTGTVTGYLDSIPLNDISNLIEEAKVAWGGGRYNWRIKIRGRWATKADELNMPLTGWFDIEGDPKAPGHDKQSQTPDTPAAGMYREAFKDSLDVVATLTKDNSGGMGEMAEVLRSMGDSARASIESVQKQAEQNVTTVLATMKASQEMLVAQMNSQRDVLLRTVEDKTKMLELNMNREREMFSWIIDLVQGNDKSMPEKVMDGFTNILDRVAPQLQQAGQPTATQAGPLPAPAEGDESMKFILNLIKIIDWCRENEVAPEKAAQSILSKSTDADKDILIKYLQTTGVDGTIEVSRKVAQAVGLPVVDELPAYAKEVLQNILKVGVDAGDGAEVGSGS